MGRPRDHLGTACCPRYPMTWEWMTAGAAKADLFLFGNPVLGRTLILSTNSNCPDLQGLEIDLTGKRGMKNSRPRYRKARSRGVVLCDADAPAAWTLGPSNTYS